MIQYTSGTTGRPKGVMLTRGNIVWNVCNLLVDVDVRSDEVALVTAPLFHTATLNQVLFPALLKGGTALIEAKSSSPTRSRIPLPENSSSWTSGDCTARPGIKPVADEVRSTSGMMPGLAGEGS